VESVDVEEEGRCVEWMLWKRGRCGCCGRGKGVDVEEDGKVWRVWMLRKKGKWRM
jgi:hypothetical protein